jgi:hypothetical protein
MLTILAAMMMAQAPAQAQLPQPATAQQPAAKKAKPKQVCEYMELTGSRSPRRVCRDVNGNVDPQPGIQSGAFDKAQSSGTPGGSN